MRICFVIKGHRFCINIPILVRDPLFHIPEPNPWIFGTELSQAELNQLQVLSTVEALSHSLPAEHGVQLRSVVEKVAADFAKRLPDFNLSFDKQKAA